MKFLDGLQPVGLLVLRLVLALIFVYHGYPKLVHPALEMRGFFVQHGLPEYFVSVAGIVECFGSLLLFLGLFTRPVALLLAIEMSVAIWKVHSAHGALAVRDYEFPLAVAAACFALATVGAGLFSMDHMVWGEGGKKRSSVKRSKQ
ncbi:MAG TPA: DoxX family protein [Candidatus Acidoferrum sp.]|jgi:putative oxidoreductase